MYMKWPVSWPIPVTPRRPWSCKPTWWHTTGELETGIGSQPPLGSQANILYARGDLDGAMAHYKEQERLCRELGNPEGLAISLVNQALILSQGMDRPQEALPLAAEAHHLAMAYGYAALAGQVKTILDHVRSRLS
jgi:hypothetical protein